MEAQKIVQKMMELDAFSQWLGIEVLEVEQGFAKLKMTVRKEMLNGFHIAHGGITYSLADSALAFAANSRGKHALSVHTSIKHITPLYEGETIVAIAEEQHVNDKLGNYEISVLKESDNELVALFEGLVYRKKEDWK